MSANSGPGRQMTPEHVLFVGEVDPVRITHGRESRYWGF